MEGVEAEATSNPCTHRAPKKDACAACFEELRVAYVRERMRAQTFQQEAKRAQASERRALASEKDALKTKNDLAEVLNIIEALACDRRATAGRRAWAHTLRDIIVEKKGDPRR